MPVEARSQATPQPVSLRERKKLKNREAIQQAALELFARKGFDHTTIEEIAEACELSPRTFFRYYANKEALLLADDDEKSRSFVEALLARPGGESPLRAIRASIMENVAAIEHDRTRMVLQRKVMAESACLRSYKVERQQGWEGAILDALRTREQNNGGSRSDFALRLVASASTAALRAAIEAWLADGGDLLAIIAVALDGISEGLAEF